MIAIVFWHVCIVLFLPNLNVTVIFHLLGRYSKTLFSLHLSFAIFLHRKFAAF